MAKTVILMMDSFGIGGAKDAAAFGDAGANTFLHIAQNYPEFGMFYFYRNDLIFESS